MKKEVKSYGDSTVITFNKEDCRIYNIESGDIIDLEFKVIKKKEE